MIEYSKGEEYITYLKYNQLPFDKDKIEIIINYPMEIPSFINKPALAFWGCPKNCEFGWKEWCEAKHFDVDNYDWKHPIKWKLKDNSKILRVSIDDVKDEKTSILNNYIDVDDEYYRISRFVPVYLNFEKILKDDIVAVELVTPRLGHMFINSLESMFNSWDCSSIVVLDKTKIEILN